MKRLSWSVVVLALIAVTPALAQQSGRAFGAATLRAGPSHQYPQVAMLARGDELQVHGCIEDWSWCDVGWQDQRGWITATMIVFDTRDDGSTVATAVPTVAFSLDDYWNAHYRTRSWFRQRTQWRAVQAPAAQTTLPDALVRQLAPPQPEWTPAGPAQPSGAWTPPDWVPPGDRMDRQLPPPDALNPKRHPEWQENTAGPMVWSPLHPAEIKLIEDEAKKKKEQESKDQKP